MFLSPVYETNWALSANEQLLRCLFLAVVAFSFSPGAYGDEVPR